MDSEQIWKRLCEIPTRAETRTIMREETRRCRRIQRKHCEKPALPPASDAKPAPWDLSWLKAAIPAAILAGYLIGGALGLVPVPGTTVEPVMPQVTAPK